MHAARTFALGAALILLQASPNSAASGAVD